MKLKLTTFGGIAPRVAPKNLADTAAQTAHNCRLKSSRLEPLLQPAVDSQTGATGLTDAVRSMHLWRRNSSAEWLTWNGNVAVAPSTINDDDKDRIWIAGATGVSSGAVNNVPAVIGWSGGAKVTRAMKKTELSAPSAAVAWKFNPLTAGAITVSCVVSGNITLRSSFGQRTNTEFTSEPLDCSITSATRGEDGALSLQFSVPAYSYVLSKYISVSYLESFYALATYTITIGASSATVTVDNRNPPVYGQRVKVVVGGTEIGEIEINNLQQSTPPSLVVQGHDADAGMPDQAYNIFTVSGPGTSMTIKCLECYSDVGNGMWGFSPGAGYYTRYIHTWVDDWGQESPPSEPSPEYFIMPGQNVTVAALTPAPATAEHRRIYRVVTGTETEAWRFVLEQDVAAGAWAAILDDVKDEDAGEEMVDMENPPDDLDGLVSLPGGFLAGFRGKEICFTDPWLPYSWPSGYRLTVDSDVVGLAVSGNDLYVLTEAFPYVVTGSHPDVMAMTKMPFPQPCMSRRSIVSSMGWVFYVSPDGLCGIQPGSGAKVMTDAYYSRREWQLLNPASSLMASHDTALHYFSSDSVGADVSLLIDFPDGKAAITTNDEHALAIFSDVETDKLYYLKDSDAIRGNGSAASIYEWQGGTTYKTFVWRSKRFQDNVPVSPSAVRVTSDGYPMTFRFCTAEAPGSFATVDVSMSLASQTARRMPKVRPERVFEIEVEHNQPIDDITVAGSMEECR